MAFSHPLVFSKSKTCGNHQEGFWFGWRSTHEKIPLINRKGICILKLQFSIIFGPITRPICLFQNQLIKMFLKRSVLSEQFGSLSSKLEFVEKANCNHKISLRSASTDCYLIKIEKIVCIFGKFFFFKLEKNFVGA